jgi:hypothetical protein
MCTTMLGWEISTRLYLFLYRVGVLITLSLFVKVKIAIMFGGWQSKCLMAFYLGIMMFWAAVWCTGVGVHVGPNGEHEGESLYAD